MEIAEILYQFERARGTFPRAAVEAAVARREEITPELLRIIDETTANAVELAEDAEYVAHTFAMLLLAQFRESRAYPLVLRFASIEPEVLDALAGEFIASDLPRVLASVCGGDLSGIKSLIANEEADQWARGAAVESLVVLVATGQISREEVVAYFAELFRGTIAREYSRVWDALVGAAHDIYAPELTQDIEAAYRDDLADESLISLKDVKRQLARGKQKVLADLARRHHYSLIDDTVAEMEFWDCFQPDSEPEVSVSEPLAAPHVEPLAPPRVNFGAISRPFRREQPKIGRNDPCPCGSGRKHKKCCGA